MAMPSYTVFIADLPYEEGSKCPPLKELFKFLLNSLHRVPCLNSSRGFRYFICTVVRSHSLPVVSAMMGGGKTGRVVIQVTQKARKEIRMIAARREQYSPTLTLTMAKVWLKRREHVAICSG